MTDRRGYAVPNTAALWDYALKPNPPSGRPPTGDKVASHWRSGRALVSAAQADAIRRRYAADGITQRELAKAYGVSHPVISQILKGNDDTRI